MQPVNQMKRGTLLALAILLVLAPLPVGGQTRHAGTRARPTRPAQPVQSTQPPGPQQKGAPTEAGAVPRVELEESPKSHALAEAFDSGKLPEPARLPAGGVDEQAAELAKAVSKGDSSSTAALYAAVLAAGYGVRERDGAVLQTRERGQGLAFEWWEVAAMSKLYGEGYGAGLGHLSESFTRNLPDLKGVALAAALLEGVRKAAQSDHPALRFWGRFIVELGRHSAEPYDLLGQVEPARVRLDAVQINFILSRLAGDFALAGRTEGQAWVIPSTDQGPVHDGRGAPVRFVKAGLRLTGDAQPSPPQHPCGATDAQGLILDANAALSTNLHGQLVKMPGLNGIRNANIVLSLLKFILSYAMLKSKVLIMSNPMERTKNTQPGGFNGLAIQVWIDNKAEAVNCMRPFLNAMGFDFNLPNNGPVTGVKVVWAGVLGFDAESRDWRDDFLDRFTEGAAKPGDAILSFNPLPGVARERATYTDGQGIAAIAAIGKPQARDLSREKLTEVLKVAGVRAWLQLKPTKIKDLTSGLSATVDALGVLTSFATLDIPSGIAGLITESAYRMSWFPTKTSYFLVKDWEPCAGLWQGTMTVTTWIERHDVDTGADGGYVKKDDLSYKFEATIKVEGARATAAIGAEEFLSNDQKSGYGRITHQRKESYQYSGAVRASVSVSSGRYDVGFELPRMMGTRQTSGSCERPAPYKCQQPTPTHEVLEFSDARYRSTITGEVDPNKPNEINDTKTFGEPGNLQHRVTVKLKRCM